jgi:hypothetical protein
LTRPYTDKNLGQPEIKDGSNSIDFFGKNGQKKVILIILKNNLPD